MRKEVVKMNKNWLIGSGFLLVWGIAGAQPPLPPPEGPGPKKFREEKREEAIEFLKKYMEPERLEKLKAKHPRLYMRALKEALKQKHRLEMLKEFDPERYELSEKILRLEIGTRNLALDYRETESKKEKEEIKKELKRILPELFDLKEKDREFELKRLEKQIDKLKDSMSERKKHKSEIIERHLNELLEEKEYMRW